MAGRRLDADEAALWARVAAGVTPLPGRARPQPPVLSPTEPKRPVAHRPSDPPHASPAPRPRPIAEATLDGGWDKRLRRGAVAPDLMVDLHGCTLAAAHTVLDRALDRALADGVRVILLVTGRPPRRDEDGGIRRGLIRASIHDWLAHSRHAARIAAVRAAHPRHGGAGALYVILRRPPST